MSKTEERYRAIMKPGDDECKICGKPTKFTTSTRGYLPTCSRSCGGVYLRRNIKADPIKYAALNAKISENNKKYRAGLSEEQRTALHAKISATLVRVHSEASPEESKRLMGVYGQKFEKIPTLSTPEEILKFENMHRNICAIFGMDTEWINELKGSIWQR